MSPTYSYGRSGRVYRYYVSASLQQGGTNRPDGILQRLSAPALERFVEERLKAITHGGATIEAVMRIDLTRTGLILTLPHTLTFDPAQLEALAMRLVPSQTRAIRIAIDVELPLRGGRQTVNAGARTAAPDTTLIAALRRAHAMVAKDAKGRRSLLQHRPRPICAASSALPFLHLTSSVPLSRERCLLGSTWNISSTARFRLIGKRSGHCSADLPLPCYRH